MRAFAAVMILGVVGASAMAAAPEPSNPFFALCMDTHDAKRRTPEQQAVLLKELGYDGLAHLWLGGVPERLKSLDAHGLKLFQIYVRVNIAPGKTPYDPRLKQVLPLLKGRGTTLGLLMGGGKPSDPAGDPRAVEILREIADLAAPHGVRIALYPHVGDCVERVEDAIRIAKKVDRPNAGAMFNLCHWLKAGGGDDAAAILKAALPHLFVVTINGADKGLGRSGGWNRLIRPLDAGTFDLFALLATLRRLGYRGPIGLQCYGLGGDARDHLARSIAAWKKLQARLAASPKETP